VCDIIFPAEFTRENRIQTMKRTETLVRVKTSSSNSAIFNTLMKENTPKITNSSELQTQLIISDV